MDSVTRRGVNDSATGEGVTGSAKGAGRAVAGGVTAIRSNSATGSSKACAFSYSPVRHMSLRFQWRTAPSIRTSYDLGATSLGHSAAFQVPAGERTQTVLPGFTSKRGAFHGCSTSAVALSGLEHTLAKMAKATSKANVTRVSQRHKLLSE